MSTRFPASGPRTLARLPLARWAEALTLLPAAARGRYYDLADLLANVVATVRRELSPDDATSIDATIYPDQMRGRVLWKCGETWYECSVTRSK